MARKELLLRLDPDLADRLQLVAFTCGVSRNQLIGDVLERFAAGSVAHTDAEEDKP